MKRDRESVRRGSEDREKRAREEDREDKGMGKGELQTESGREKRR